MTDLEAIDARFSCRAYTDEPLDAEAVGRLRDFAATLGGSEGLRIAIVGPQDGGGQLRLSSRMFAGSVSTYAALVGPDDNLVRERIGYLGERLVLHATKLGLGTCWVAGTFDRKSVTVGLGPGELLHDVVTIGHKPDRQPLAQRTIRAGLRRRSKKAQSMYDGPQALADAPGWVRAGVEAVAKGPSAVNEQPVVFSHDGATLRATLPRLRRDLEFTDLGIAKLHFQIAAEAAGMPGAWEWGADGAYVVATG